MKDGAPTPAGPRHGSLGAFAERCRCRGRLPARSLRIPLNVMTKTAPSQGASSAGRAADTREHLKRVARRLFAERGVDGVAIRDIVAASGQRNGASIHYYFGTKDALVRELIIDGASFIDERRNRALDELEQSTPAPSVAELVELLIRTSFGDPRNAEDATFLRFIAALQLNRREQFMDALGNRWNRGFQRAIEHIRKACAHVPAAVLNSRLVQLSVTLGAMLAQREAALADPARAGSLWRDELLVRTLVDGLSAMLLAPPSAATLAALSTGSRRN